MCSQVKHRKQNNASKQRCEEEEKKEKRNKNKNKNKKQENQLVYYGLWAMA
jgi:hypothetical protein